MLTRHIRNNHVILYKGKTVKDIRTGLKKGCKKAEIEYCSYEDFSFHTLRHTFKTDCRRAGISDNVSEAIMGHSESNSMSKRYEDITDQNKLFAVSNLEAYRSSVSKSVNIGVN